MGKPKPLVEFDGETCLSLVLNACLGSLADETILVLGAEADRVHAEATSRAARERDGRVTTVVNEAYTRGQTSTLKTGLEASSTRSDAFVLFPVDHPLITSREIDALISRLAAHPRGRSIFVATYDDRRGHPVLFAASHRSAILGLGDDEPLHDYIRLRDGETEQVPTGNPGVVTGMNTPEEYKALLEIYRSSVKDRKDRPA